jgi:hypothetical protein
VKYSGTSVLQIRIRDPVLFDPCIREPDLGSGTWKKLDPDPGWKKVDPDPGLTSQIIFPRAWKQFFGLNILKFFAADPGSKIFLTLDPGWKNSDLGSGINIPDPQH